MVEEVYHLYIIISDIILKFVPNASKQILKSLSAADRFYPFAQFSKIERYRKLRSQRLQWKILGRFHLLTPKVERDRNFR